MLLNRAWSEVWFSSWVSVLSTIVIFSASCLLGVQPESFFFSYGGLAVMAAVASGGIFFSFLFTAFPLFVAHKIITGGADTLPESFRPELERVERAWRKRTPVRYIELLKAELAAAEERVEVLAMIDAYTRYYQQRAAPSTEDAEAYISALEESRVYIVKKFGDDEDQIAQLIERIDAIYAEGDVAAEIRMVEEHLDNLRYQRRDTPAEWTEILHRIDTKIRAGERDIAELRNWQASRTKLETPTPQRERFEHVKTVEYDNERIQIWARHAKFKAYEEQLAMKKEEREKIQSRVARGELSRHEADYLLQKLDEYFGENDDRIFA